MKKSVYLFLILIIFILTANISVSKEIYGIGICIDKNNNCPYPIIKGIINNSPASKSLMQPGDIILKINDEDASKMGVLNVLTGIRGPEESCVNLLIQRNHKNIPFSLRRCRIK